MAVNLDKSAVDAAFSQPDSDGTFSGAFGEYLGKLAQRRPVLLFAFAPKAAGTFLRTAAIAATGGQLVRVVHAQGGRDAQPYLPVFIYYYYGGVCEAPMVVHMPMQALPGNRNFIEALGLKPIVMLRSIPDMLASLCDMLASDEDARRDSINCKIPEAFPAFDKERRADFLIDMIAPWYASYFATWLEFAAAKPETVCLLRYADMIAQPAEVLARALSHAGLEKPLDICRAAIAGTWDERGALRFNKGVAGRGREYFSPAHFARIERMLANFSALDGWHGELL
jgi:hypothetical protein